MSLGRVKNRHRSPARRNHDAIGKADPLATVMIEKLVADGPVGRFVSAPVRMYLSGDFRGQLVGNARMAHLECVGCRGVVILLRFFGLSSRAREADEFL